MFSITHTVKTYTVQQEKNLSIHRLSTLLRVFQFPVEFRILVPYVHMRWCILYTVYCILHTVWCTPYTNFTRMCLCLCGLVGCVASRRLASRRCCTYKRCYMCVRACVRACVMLAYHVHCAAHCAVCTVHGVRVSVSETKHIGDSRTGKQPQSKQFARLIDFPWHPRFGVTGPCNALHRPICGDKRSHEHTNASTSTNSIGYGILPFDYQTGLRPADCKSAGKLCAAELYGTSSIVSTIDRISLYRCLCIVFSISKCKLAMYGIITRYKETTHRGFAKERRNTDILGYEGKLHPLNSAFL